MRSSLNPLARLRRNLGQVAAALLLFFGVAQAVAAWHVTRGADQEPTSVAADQPASPAGGHVDDGCALCSTPVQQPFSAVLIVVALGSIPPLVLPRDGFLRSSPHFELGASGPRAPPAVS